MNTLGHDSAVSLTLGILIALGSADCEAMLVACYKTFKWVTNTKHSQSPVLPGGISISSLYCDIVTLNH